MSIPIISNVIDTIGFALKQKSQRQGIYKHSGRGVGFGRGEQQRFVRWSREMESCTPEGWQVGVGASQHGDAVRCNISVVFAGAGNKQTP